MPSKEWYQKNKEANKIYQQQYNADNKERISKRSKTYHEENKEVLKLRSKQFRDNNREHYLNKKYSYRVKSFDAIIKLGLNKARGHAKTYKREFNITHEYLMTLLVQQDYKCAISQVRMTHNKDIYTVSIDRIDSSKGYVEGNVQLVCKFCNLGKNTHSNQEALDFIKTIEMNLLKKLKDSGVLKVGIN